MWRVLLVEAQPDYASALCGALRQHAELRLVASTEDGAQATRLAKVLRPDAILMSVDLCAQERFKVLENIRSHTPTRVLVYASGRPDDRTSLERAPDFGATRTCTSAPESPGAIATIVSSLQALCATEPPPAAPSTSIAAPLGAPAVRGVRVPEPRTPVVLRGAKPPPEAIQALDAPARVVAIGASTGGPAAIERMLRRWPSSFALPVVVAQHMTPGFNRDLVSWLDSLGSLRVKLAEHGEKLSSGVMYFAPDGQHVSLFMDQTLRLTAATAEDTAVPSVDLLFHSVACVFGAASMGILLTGMGEDGARGLLDMRRIGARTIAQDQKSSLVFGMPRAAIGLGAAELVLNLDEIASVIADGQGSSRRGRR